jgi:hypothetical protein
MGGVSIRPDSVRRAVAAAVNPTEARFPAVPLKAGHYESFYLKLCRPGEPLGAWIRYTVHKRPREVPVGSLWFTLFEDDGPRASKLTLPAPVAGEDGEWIRVGEGSLSPAPAARFDGRLTVDSREIAVEGWRGMVGHNWGSQHAERWIWLHGSPRAAPGSTPRLGG